MEGVVDIKQLKKPSVLLFLLLMVPLGWVSLSSEAVCSRRAQVVREGNKIYLVDRAGERWDITQARSLGFKPENFEFGLGRFAITPLDDSFLKEAPARVPPELPVIGVADGLSAKAYSIPRLTRHEIVNSHTGSKPIAVAY